MTRCRLAVAPVALFGVFGTAACQDVGIQPPPQVERPGPDPQGRFPPTPSGLRPVAFQAWSDLSWGWTNRRGEVRITEIDGSSALEMFYPEGLPDGYEPGVAYFPLSHREIFLATRIRFDERFEQHRLGMKLHVFLTSGSWDLWLNEQAHFRSGEGNVPPGFGIGIKGPGAPQNVEYVAGDNLPHNRNEVSAVGLGEWIDLAMHVRISDPGQANGIVRLWIDGSMVTDYTDLRWADPGAQFVEFQHAGTWGGGGTAVPRPQSWYVDETTLLGN